jgi:hypothetical protein
MTWREQYGNSFDVIKKEEKGAVGWDEPRRIPATFSSQPPSQSLPQLFDAQRKTWEDRDRR